MATYDWPATSDGENAAAYAKTVLTAIKNGDAEYSFAPLKSAWNGHTATFKVLSRPIRIDGFYPGAGARLAQQVADLIGCIFTTGRLSDLSFAQRVVNLLPIGLANTQQQLLEMQYVSTMRKYASMLDAAAKAAGYTPGVGILNSVGKPWIIDNLLADTPTKAENYGWHVAYPGGVWASALSRSATGDPAFGVVQGYWWPPAHDAAQTDSYGGDQADYSEVLSGFVHRTCTVDGKDRDIVEVASDPETAGLVTVDGKPLKIFRQPNVPVYACVSKSAIGAQRFVSALGEDLCPTPPPPSNYSNDGDGSWGPLMVGAGVAAVGVAGYLTRRRWLPAVRRVWRRL